ncbi:MAG: hypothetical protein NUV65_02080 [Candidatus Roizmanbacteria bacterium]|nr:hypothetical protein [Candidatus Roizmanbacteria bacterium]
MSTKENFLIVLCGMDGTGKSTLAKKLAEYYENRKFAVHIKHAHTYTISPNSFAVNDSNIDKYKWFFSLLVPFAYFDNLFTYWYKYRKEFVDKILICDRYFYDKVAHLIYYGICSKPLAKIYLRLLPKPKYALFLDAPPEKAKNRKKEHSLKELTRYREIYSYIASTINAPIIKTDVSIQNSFEEILSYVSR